MQSIGLVISVLSMMWFIKNVDLYVSLAYPVSHLVTEVVSFNLQMTMRMKMLLSTEYREWSWFQCILFLKDNVI